MKKHLFALACLVLALSSCGPVYVVHQDPPPQPAPAPPPPEEVSYQSFYDQLSPYGQWIDDPGYGYVWLPNVGPDFKPYSTNGHWVYTDEGWTWASEYPWGWATFHYGRWFYQDGYGWEWIPGHEWSPAWVSWRNSPDYYGWAPLGPNVSINISIGGGYNPPPHYWNFVPHQYVASPQVNNYTVNESRNTTIINNTTVINNTVINNNVRNTNISNNNITNNNTTNTRINNRYYAGGPSADEVGRFTGAPLRPVALRETNTPGERVNNDGLAIYRPRVNAATAPGANRGAMGNDRPAVAPARTQQLNNVRPVNTMRYNNSANGAEAVAPPQGRQVPSQGMGNSPASGYTPRPVGNTPPAANPLSNPQPAGGNAPGSNGYSPRGGNTNPNGSNQNGSNPNGNTQNGNFQNGGNNQNENNQKFRNNPNDPYGQPRQRTVMPVQPQMQNGRAGQPVPAQQGNAPAQPSAQAPHAMPPAATVPNGGQPRGTPIRTNPNPAGLKPPVKTPPPAHQGDDHAKDKDKDKDKKEQ